MQAIYTGYNPVPMAPIRVRPSLPPTYNNAATPFALTANQLPSTPQTFALSNPAFFQPSSPQPPSPKQPSKEQRLKAAAKALALITPAILLARFAPGQSAKQMQQLFPSDWKVWAKMGLGVASLGEFNKALNWQPEPWLGAMMNVAIISPLISGTRGLRMLPVLLPTVAALVQGTHLASEKAEKPLEEKWNVPPIVTRLAFSAISMAAGFVAIPRMLGAFKGTWVMPEAQPGMGTTSAVTATCSRGCCSSTVCLNEIADYGAAFTGWLQGKSPSQQTEGKR